MTSEVIEFQLARQRVNLRPPEDLEPLSPREREVLARLAVGRSDGEIAEELFISKKTASVHVANIKAKLGAGSRVEIALLAARLGLIEEGARAQPESRHRGGPRVVCPFKGLANYEMADAPFFFGRERLVAELVARLAGGTFVAVVGPSGSGKSSLVRAGLLPAIGQGVLPGSDAWGVAVMRPGARPLSELDHALTTAIRRTRPDLPERVDGTGLDSLAPGARVLIVVDQFEETFTLGDDDRERSQFLRGIVALARDPSRRALVVIAVRADYYGRCAEDRDLAELLAAGHVLVGPMSTDELIRTIELPARAAGLRVDAELTAALVEDVAEQPGGLPLLSTTLLDLWQQRDGRTLRRESYDRSGGVSGSISRLAESAMARLSEDEREAARAILLRLATGAGQTTVARRPVPVAELDGNRNPRASAALRILLEYRLVTVDEGTVEVAHDVLLTDWPRLRQWLDDDAAGRRLRVGLMTAAREWQLGGNDPAELYRGARLAAALEWAGLHESELNDIERKFLEEGRLAAEGEVHRERRVNRRLRVLLAGVLLLLVFAVGAGAIALQQRLQAEAETLRARVGELTASALSVIDDDPALAKLLALSAASLAAPPPVETLSVLHRAWAADRVVFRYQPPADRAVDPLWTDLDRSGRLILSTAGFLPPTPNDYIEVIDRTTGEVTWSVDLDNPAIGLGPAFFTRDGEHVVAGVGWMTGEGDAETRPSDLLGVHIWNLRTGDERIVPTGRCGGMVTAVSATNVLVRTLPDDPAMAPDCFSQESDLAALPLAVEVVSLETGGRTLIGTDGAMTDDGALSGDGRFVAFDDETSDAARLVVVEVATGRVVMEFDVGSVDQQWSWARALNEDGSLLLFGDVPIAVIDVRLPVATDGKPHVAATFAGHGGESGFARFATGSDDVYSTGRDSTLRRWDGRTGVALEALGSIGDGRPAAIANGLVLVGNVLVDGRVRGEVGAFATCTGRITATSLDFVDGTAAFSRNCGPDWQVQPGHAEVIDVAAGRPLHASTTSEGQSLRISPDGTRFVVQDGPFPQMGPLSIRDLRTGALVHELRGLCGWDWSDGVRVPDADCRSFPEQPFPIWMWQVEWSPDGTTIAAIDHAGFFDGFVAVWDASTGELVHTWDPEGSGTWIEDVLFSADSRRLYVATTPQGGWGEIRAFDTTTWETMGRGSLPREIEGGDRPGLVGLLPDGSAIIGIGGHVAGPAASSLYWLDPDSLALAGPGYRNGIHDGSHKSVDLSEDGQHVVTGSSDGFVRMWDATTGSLVHEIQIGDTQVQGVAFVSDRHVAVAPEDGNLLIYTVDPEELETLTRTSLTRSFTDLECARFGIDPCPTLVELKAGG